MAIPIIKASTERQCKGNFPRRKEYLKYPHPNLISVRRYDKKTCSKYLHYQHTIYFSRQGGGGGGGGGLVLSVA